MCSGSQAASGSAATLHVDFLNEPVLQRGPPAHAIGGNVEDCSCPGKAALQSSNIPDVPCHKLYAWWQHGRRGLQIQQHHLVA